MIDRLNTLSHFIILLTFYTGLTRILGIGEFGEYATLSFKRIDARLLNELRKKK